MGHALPIAPGEFGRIVDAQLALMGRADQMHTAERFFGEPAEVFALVFIDQQNALTAAQQLIRGDHARQSAARDDHIGLTHSERISIAVGQASWPVPSGCPPSG